MKIDREELAWAAGFFDGEGTVTLSSGHTAFHVMVSQADVRPLLRFKRAVLDLGRISGPWQPNPRNGIKSNKPMYRWAVTDWRGAQAVVALLWPLLSEPKREQATLKATDFNFRIGPRLRPPGVKVKGKAERCTNRHPYTEENTYRTREDYRRCRMCQRLSNLARQVRRFPCPTPGCTGQMGPNAKACRSCSAKEWQARRRAPTPPIADPESLPLPLDG